MRRLIAAAAVALTTGSATAGGFFFFLPLPNTSKPPELERLMDTLEKSSEVRALAWAAEDKTFGSKYYVWGHAAGGGRTQDEANFAALQACSSSLAAATSKREGGQPLYNFGGNSCKLHPFTPNGAGLAKAKEPAPAENATPSAEARLRQVDDLLAKGLISAEEHREKRQAIINSL